MKIILKPLNESKCFFTYVDENKTKYIVLPNKDSIAVFDVVESDGTRTLTPLDPEKYKILQPASNTPLAWEIRRCMVKSLI